MKKIIMKSLLGVAGALLLTMPAYAAQDQGTAANGEFTLGAAGVVSTAANTLVSYGSHNGPAAGAGTLGGYTVTAQDCAMGVLTASSRPNDDMGLVFWLRSCQGPSNGCTEDNQVYQNNPDNSGQPFTQATMSTRMGDPEADNTGWAVRGGS